MKVISRVPLLLFWVVGCHKEQDQSTVSDASRRGDPTFQVTVGDNVHTLSGSPPLSISHFSNGAREVEFAFSVGVPDRETSLVAKLDYDFTTGFRAAGEVTSSPPGPGEANVFVSGNSLETGSFELSLGERGFIKGTVQASMGEIAFSGNVAILCMVPSRDLAQEAVVPTGPENSQEVLVLDAQLSSEPCGKLRESLKIIEK